MQYSAVQQYNTVHQYSITVQHRTVQYSAVQNSAVVTVIPYIMVHYNTVQRYSSTAAVQYSKLVQYTVTPKQNDGSCLSHNYANKTSVTDMNHRSAWV